MDNIRIPGVHDNLNNVQPGNEIPVVRRQMVVAVVAILMLNGLLGGIWEQHAPAPACVVAAPQSGASRIDSPGIARIEGEGRYTVAQVKHPPGLSAILRNVASRHVAVFQHDLRVVRADGGGNHGPAAARSNDLPRIEARRGAWSLRGGGNRQRYGDHRKPALQFQTRSNLRDHLLFPERQLTRIVAPGQAGPRIHRFFFAFFRALPVC